MQGGNNLAIPGRLDIGVLHHPSPMAQQVQINIPKANGMDIHAFGGLSKVEHAVCLLAAGYRDLSAADVVARAKELLAACAADEKESSQHGQETERAAPPPTEPAASPGGILVP